MFDRPPAKAKEDVFNALQLPTVIVSETKKPQDWIRVTLES
jgi:hypothetical protein